jgi:NhaP-type Na+/H+ or K+/H+ antiporter
MIGLTSIVLLGAGAQWLAWRLRIPSILLLLTVGVLAGPATGFLGPDELLGPLLLPIVSLSVAVILFEGGLNLNLRELRGIGSAFIGLATIGVIVTWTGSALAAWWLLGLQPELAALLGAVLVVTGPTVIGPLLRHLRLGGQAGALLKWEGIVIDPVGAMLGVAVFAFVRARGESDGTWLAVLELGKTVLIGGVFGALGAGALYWPMRRYWIPDSLQNPVTLAAVFGVFTLSNVLQAESGLLSVTLMGLALANQKSVPVRHLIEFKENLTVLLLSNLFIILSARLTVADLQSLDAGSAAFVALLMLVVRPLSVLLGTFWTPLTWPERAFLCCMAPRGIVAASVISVFAIEMTEFGFDDASRMVPVMFLVVFSTVLIYGLAASPIAQRLGLAQPNPQGVLFVGAHSWARAMAYALQRRGCPVLMVDSDWTSICAARMAGLSAYHGSVLAERTLDEINLSPLGRMLALTSNNEVNSLACLRFREVFGRRGVYQLAFRSGAVQERESISAEQRGRLLFRPELNFLWMSQLAGALPNIISVKLTKESDYAAFRKQHAHELLPLFVLKDGGIVQVFSVDEPPAPQPGDQLLCLVAATSLPEPEPSGELAIQPPSPAAP